MADYYSTTVLQPKLPLKDMTAAEYLILTGIFQHEIVDGAVYFFAEFGPRDRLEFDMSEVRQALAADIGHDTEARRWFQDRLDHVGDALDHITMDISTKSYELIIQEIIRRSNTLSYVWVITSYHCSRMRHDGFGGAASVITAYQFRFK